MEGEKIKIMHLVFLLAVAILIVAFSVMPSMELPSGLVITNEKMWALGFSPSFITLGLVLGIASIASWKGSIKAFYICRCWGAIYSLVIGGMVAWYFPSELLVTIGLGVIWSVVWFFSIRNWYVKHGV